MNFSNACRLKKGLSLILIVLMVVGMFSGCKKNNSETEPNTTPSLNLNMSDTSAPTQETVPPTTTEPIVYNENMGTVTNQISVRVIPSKDANVTGTLDAGTVVEILRQETIADITWGMISTPVSGWICMDYVTMISYDDIPGNNSNNGSNSGNKGTGVDSFDEAERTTTTAVYTGSVKADTTVYKTPNPNLKDNTVRTISANENITIHELTAVTLEIYEGDKVDDKNKNNDVETVVKQTSYWARINDGWIKDPDVNIQLNALDEKVHTVTGASNLNVRGDAGTTYGILAELKKGDQVPVTKLKIVKDSGTRTLTVWGRVETSDGIVGYCDLSYMSEGALYEKKEEPTTPTTPSAPTIGSTGNTGDGGFVNNKGGYKNTGKVIIETFTERGIDPVHVPGVLCASHGPFTWGKDAAQAVYHAVVLEEVAKMAILTLTIDPNAHPAPQHVLDKHFMRKHGPNAYYGQK